jgi:hypothetical protein
VIATSIRVLENQRARRPEVDGYHGSLDPHAAKAALRVSVARKVFPDFAARRKITAL